MSQKKKNKETETSKDKWNKEEDPLQAVVVADSFNSKFLPITVERPRVRHMNESKKIGPPASVRFMI